MLTLIQRMRCALKDAEHQLKCDAMAVNQIAFKRKIPS